MGMHADCLFLKLYCMHMCHWFNVSSAVSLRRPSIGFVATYHCRYDRFYRYFLSFHCLSLPSFITNYERGRHKLSSNAFDIEFSVEALPPPYSAQKNCFKKDEWMSMSDTLNLRCAYSVDAVNTASALTIYLHYFVHCTRDSQCTPSSTSHSAVHSL
jgi:hypothetical protein